MSSHDPRGLASLILGLVATLLLPLSYLVGFLPLSLLAMAAAIVGLVLSVQARKQRPHSGLGVAGMVLSIIALAFGFLLILVFCGLGCYAFHLLGQMHVGVAAVL